MHRAPITAVKYTLNDAQAVSSSIDGSIIIWDMKPGGNVKPLQKLGQMDMPPAKGPDGAIVTGILLMAVNENTNTLLTLGLDKRISYWDLSLKRMTKQL